MELATFLVQAVLQERRSVREVARSHGVSKTWLYELLSRYKAGGEEALQPKSRRPKYSPLQIPPSTEDEIVRLRKRLSEFGVDAGAETIHAHLERAHGAAPCSVSTIWRVLRRRGFVTPEPHKRPKSSFIRFEASLPNECWQMDMTHVELRSGRSVEVLNVIDDHSRLCLLARAFPVTTAKDVVSCFYDIAAQYGFPASVLSDNGGIFTASFRGDRGALSTELARIGVKTKHSRPYHPQTCGKVERFQQTEKKFLKNKVPKTINELQERLDVFVAYYNDVRPHRAKGRKTPRSVYDGKIKAGPQGKPIRDAGEFRIRHDRVDACGKVTLRYAGKLRHLGIGRAHKREHVMLLVDDKDVRVLSADGEFVCSFRIDPEKTYQARLA